MTRTTFTDVLPGAAVALGVVALIGLGVGGEIAWNQHHTQTCTVESKQATGTKSGNQYLLYTKECGQLQVGDELLQGKFNSTDTFAGIKEGHVYTVDTVGWRNGFFSQYPNVLTATELNGK